jgi:PilZ domain
MYYERKRIRIPVSLPVTLTTVLDMFEGRIIDLTEDGARIACPGLPRGERLQIDYRGQTIFARCMWSEVDRIGVTFPFPLTDGPLHDQLRAARVNLAGLAETPPIVQSGRFGRRAGLAR